MRQFKPVLFLAFSAIIMLGSCRKEITPAKQDDQPTCAFLPPPPPQPTGPIAYCGSTNVSMVTDNGTVVGSITVGNDATNLYVQYNLTNGYKAIYTGVYAGTLAGIPKSSNGNANPYAFANHATHYPFVTTFTYTIPLSSLPNTGGCNTVVAYGDIVKTNSYGWITWYDGAYGQGTMINGNASCNNGGMYFSWCNATCGFDPPPEK